jgi:hypothetical protein
MRVWRSYYADQLEVVIRFFGIRFDPKGMLALIANAPEKSPSVPVAKPPGSDSPESEEKGPPVSPVYLRAWYALYKQVYQGASDTEDNAWASARGMFPGKSVSRDSVRALRGPQRPGRKPSDPAK